MMIKLKTYKIFFLAVCVITLTANPNNLVFAHNRPIYHGMTASSAILIDIKKNKVLFAKNIHQRMEPASTIKVMTAILVLERMNLEKTVVASLNACGQQPSKANLAPGVNYKIKDLLHAMLMGSANDATTCLAEAVSGSESEFAKLMTKRARQFGCRNSYFINSNGLPSKKGRQYSTVYDLSIMIRRLMKHRLASEIMGKKYYAFRGSNGTLIKVTNHNKLLWKHPGVAVGKTGFTLRAKHCFVGKDTLDKKEIVFAVLKSRNLWPDVSYLLRLAKCT